MKIDDQGAFEAARTAGINPVQRIGPAFQLFGAYGASPVQGADTADVSAQAQELRDFAARVKALPDVREDKVSALEQRLASGDYQVPVADLAEAMFRLSELDTQG
ncbi:MAG: flagellar biosynthesis anti-sigma factor FlgM [Candidatus Sericytochromatia bacterium]